MARLLIALLLTAGAHAALAASTYFELIEHAAEVEQLRLSDGPGQLLYARRCDECPTLALSLNSESRVFDGNRPISLTAAAALRNRGGTVMFDPATRLITRIVFWPAQRETS